MNRQAGNPSARMRAPGDDRRSLTGRVRLAVLAGAVAAAVTAVGALYGAEVRAQDTGSTRSVKEGVYTTAQAERGGAVYEEKCTSCHVARMWGSDWTEKSVFELYDTINGYMPQDSPGSLSPQQSRDLVAYILRTNKLPAGTAELPESSEAMMRIRLEQP